MENKPLLHDRNTVSLETAVVTINNSNQTFKVRLDKEEFFKNYLDSKLVHQKRQMN